jgi:anti-anti-sigma factor
MHISSEELAGGVLRVNLEGRLDVTGAKEIDQKFALLTAAPRSAVVVDLSRVVFLASIGIRLLLISAKDLESRGGRMALLSPDTTVAKVLELSGLDTTIGVFRDLKEACKAVVAS